MMEPPMSPMGPDDSKQPRRGGGAGVPPPIVVSFLVCEMITPQRVSQQLSLHRLVNSIVCKRVPVTVPTLFVFCELSNGRGVERFRLKIVDAGGERAPVAEAEVDFDMVGPLGTSELVMATERLVFPEAGEYRVQVMARGAMLAERRLVVRIEHASASGPNAATYS